MKQHEVALTVKAVVVNKNDEVLLLRRSGDKEKFHGGCYDLPGGYLDEGDRINDALLREIEEETGLIVSEEDVKLICIEDFESTDKIKGIRFLVRYSGDDLVVLSDEHDEYVWLSFDEAVTRLKIGTDYEEGKARIVAQAKKIVKEN
ncbi:MAG: NUDIX domain-containing protein [Patescibacteria group bacterium]